MTDVDATERPEADQTEEAGSRFITRTPPTFDTIEEERRHRIERLAGVCRVFGHAGFSEGLLGHVTVRDPEHEELLWANPMGVSFSRMRASDIVQIDHEGNLLQGDRAVNPVGVLLHAAVHRARPEVVGICHAHSTHGSAWSSFGRLVEPITQDCASFFERQALIVEPRLVIDPETADRWAAAFGQQPVALQAGHGIFTAGRTVDEAAWWFLSYDKACQIQLLAQAAATGIGEQPERWPEEQARLLAGAFGSPEFGWLSFQNTWDEIVESDPDLFD